MFTDLFAIYRDTVHYPLRLAVVCLLLWFPLFACLDNAAGAEFSESEKLYLKDHGVLRVQLSEDWPPFNYTEHGTPKGYVNDYLLLLGQKLGIEIEFIGGHTWPEYLQMLESGDIDFISNMTITPKRLNSYLFSEMDVVDVLTGLLTLSDAKELGDLERLHGEKLAVVKGYSHEEILQSHYADIPQLPTENLLNSIKQVMAGKAVAAIGAHSVFNYFIGKHLLTDTVSTPIMSNVLFPSAPHHLAVRRDNRQLMSILDKAMSMVTKSELMVLRQKWAINSSKIKHIRLTEDELLFLEKKQEIAMCVDPDWMPIEKIDNGQHVGMAADYITLLEKYIDLPITLTPTTSWIETIEFAKERKCDIISLAMSTPERRKFMLFSEPYFATPLVVSTKSSGPFLSDIMSEKDKKFGVEGGYAFGPLLRSKYPPISIVDIRSVEDGLRLVEAGELYGFIGTLPTLAFGIQSIGVGELKIAGKLDEQLELRIAIRNDEPQLLNVFNKAINLIDEIEHVQILNRWISVKYEKGIDTQLIRRILLGAAVVIVLLLIRHYSLGKYNKKLQEQNIEIRKQAELLEQTRHQLLLTQYAVDSCSFPIFWMHSQTDLGKARIIHANNATAHVLGYSLTELSTLKLTDIDILLTEQIWQDILTELRNHKAHSCETTYRAKDGSSFPVELYISSFDYMGISYHFVFFSDVSRQKEMETKLHRSMKMEAIGILAGGVAHDLNNILSGIISYPELLLLKLPPESEYRSQIQAIQRSGQQAALVVADLLTVARGVAAIREPSNFNDLILEYFNSPEHKKLVEQYPYITWVTKLDKKLLNIACSQIHIKKTIMNLVINAVEAISDKGTISISTQSQYIEKQLAHDNTLTQGEYVVFTITDTGGGISNEDLSHIFDPFYSKKVMGKSGTGLGLTVVYNTIQDHSGTILTDSTSEGTTFTIFLPTTRDGIVAKQSEFVTAELLGNMEQIMVVDDSSQQLDIAEHILVSLNYKPILASSGEIALELLQTTDVDLILLDMIMDPGMSGRETYTRISQIKPGQKAIIVSGFSPNDDVVETQKLGAETFLHKPYARHEIAKVLHEVLHA